MAADSRQGRIKLHVHKARTLAEEYGGLIWDMRSARREEHPSCPNHCCDATLYAWRHAYAYLSERPEARPPPGSAAAYAEEARRMEQEELDRLEADNAEAREWEGYV